MYGTAYNYNCFVSYRSGCTFLDWGETVAGLRTGAVLRECCVLSVVCVLRADILS